MEERESFLIIRRDNIGDLVCTTPLIRALRARFPTARVDALVNSYNQPVLAGNPDLDNVYAYTKAKHRDKGQSLIGVHWRRLKLLLQLRHQSYGTVILANDGDTARARKLARWVAPRRIIGFGPDFVGPAAGNHAPVPSGSDLPGHAAEITFRLLKPLGIDGPPPALRIQADPEARERAFRSLDSRSPAAGRTLAIHISARKVPQRWPAGHFADFMRRVHALEQARFMLFWSPGDEDNPLHPGDDRKAQEIIQATRGLPVLPYPTHRLEELIGGLSACAAMVCSDGGAMHLGAGLGLPIVCFFGNSDALRWHPWGVPHELLQKSSRDVRDISVEEAVAAYERLMGRPEAR